MNSVNPDKDAIKSLLKLKKDRPVVMLNLLKFKDKTEDGVPGRKKYQEYEKAVAPLLKKVGGRPIWLGKPETSLIGGFDWDMTLLVKYPSARAFLQMVASQEYQSITHLRESALEKAGLIAHSEFPLEKKVS